MREHREHIYYIPFSRKESVEEPEYLGRILLAALLLAPTLTLSQPEHYRSLSVRVEEHYQARHRHLERMKVIRARLLATTTNFGEESEEVAEVYAAQADCYHDLGRWVPSQSLMNILNIVDILSPWRRLVEAWPSHLTCLAPSPASARPPSGRAGTRRPWAGTPRPSTSTEPWSPSSSPGWETT